MKDHYQLAAELLQYRDEYEAKQRKKKLYAVRICAAVLCCGAVLAAAGHAVSRSPKPAETTFTETATESRNIININRVSAALGDNGRKMNICLNEDDRVELDADGMNAYCGTNIFPKSRATSRLGRGRRSSVFTSVTAVLVRFITILLY